MATATHPTGTEATIVVYGVATQYAWEVVESVGRLGREAICVDNLGGADPELPGLRTALPEDRELAVALAPSSPGARATAAQRAHAEGGREFPALVDPTAAVATTSQLGHGSYVNALVSVGARTSISCLASINRSSTVGHHNRLGRFTCTGPGVTLCGGVQTGPGVFLGAGSIVLPNRRVGAYAVVGAGAVVTRDVPDRVVVVGNPARVVGDAPAWDGPETCPLC